MSTGFDILITPGQSFKDRPVEFYKDILRLVMGSGGVRRTGIKVTIYREQRPFNYGAGSNDPSVIFEQKFDDEKSVEELIGIIEGIDEQNFFLGVTCTYDRLRWDNNVCDCVYSAGWLDVEYESPKFDLGYRSKGRSSHRIHFDNRNYFSPRVVDLSKCPSSSPAAQSKLVRYGTNREFVKSLFKEISTTLKPSDSILVTEGARINPLNFHMVYHNQISKYLFDVRKMLQMHQTGGGYFYDGRAGNFDPAYRTLSDQGSRYADDIRSEAEARDLANRLDLFTNLLGGSGEMHLAEEEIFEIISSFDEIETELIGQGFCTASSNFLFGYLDVVYEGLLDRVVSKSIGKI